MDPWEVQELIWLMQGLLKGEVKAKVVLCLTVHVLFLCGSFGLLGNMLKLTDD